MRISRRCSAGLVYPVASSQNGLYKIVASLIIIKFSHVFLAWKFGAQFGISSIFLLFTVLVAQQCRFSWSWMDGWMDGGSSRRGSDPVFLFRKTNSLAAAGVGRRRPVRNRDTTCTSSFTYTHTGGYHASTVSICLRTMAQLP